MQHILFQDILAIVGLVLGPMLALFGTMWHHSNGQFKEIKEEIKEMKEEMKEMEIRLTNKIDVLTNL